MPAAIVGARSQESVSRQDPFDLLGDRFEQAAQLRLRFGKGLQVVLKIPLG
jgi:hypothetical protein